MVEAAPSFEEVAAALAFRLDGAVLVAHNLSFDTRMLRQEYERLDADFDEGRGHCTLRLTSENLEAACARYGIVLEGHHRALVDARATSELLRRVLDDAADGTPAAVGTEHLPLSPRTLRRDASVGSQQSQMARIVSQAQYPTSDGAMLSYLNMLDWVLDDLVITQTEREHMVTLAAELGIGSAELQVAHDGYVLSMVSAAQRDGVITEAEHSMIEVVASALGVNTVTVPEVTDQVDSGPLVRGLRVCFTGEAIMNGKKFDRTDLEAWAAQAGLQPVSSVTKKGCDLLVAADPSSMSGKAKKAHDYGKPIMSIEDFVTDCAALQIGGQDL
jgi:DNA polymerase-3 subunit epsilon